jgi:hypothetical protein
MNPSVSIIILNWNGWEETLECLESIYQIDYHNYQVILVDNHSQDQSLEKIREYSQGKITLTSPFFKYNPNNKPIKINELTKQETEQRLNGKKTTDNHLTLIKNDENYGFAPGNNIALKYTLKEHNPDYILLLNNDTVVNPDFLTKLIQATEKDPYLGISGPLIYFYDFDGRKDVVANLGGKVNLGKYPGYYDLTEIHSLKDYSGDLVECDWVSGAALLLKIKDLPIKLLNEDLFFGCEDIDLALNLKEYGYKSVVVLDSLIWHKEGVSRKKRSSEKINRALLEIRSNLTFLKAHKNHFYWYLPVYLFQIFVLYLKIIIKRN